METFHNGCYAICDVASHHLGMCSDISAIADQRQADRSITPCGGGPRVLRTRAGDGRGEKSAAELIAGIRPSRFPSFPLVPGFLFSLKPR